MEIVGEGKPQVSWDGGKIPVVMFKLFRNNKWNACRGLALSDSRPWVYNRNFWWEAGIGFSSFTRRCLTIFGVVDDQKKATSRISERQFVHWLTQSLTLETESHWIERTGLGSGDSVTMVVSPVSSYGSCKDDHQTSEQRGLPVQCRAVRVLRGKVKQIDVDWWS